MSYEYTNISLPFVYIIFLITEQTRAFLVFSNSYTQTRYPHHNRPGQHQHAMHQEPQAVVRNNLLVMSGIISYPGASIRKKAKAFDGGVSPSERPTDRCGFMWLRVAGAFGLRRWMCVYVK